MLKNKNVIYFYYVIINIIKNKPISSNNNLFDVNIPEQAYFHLFNNLGYRDDE